MKTLVRWGTILLIIAGLMSSCAAMAPVAPLVGPVIATGPVGIIVTLTVVVVGTVIIAIFPTGQPPPIDLPADAKIIDIEVNLVTATLIISPELVTWMAYALPKSKSTEGESRAGEFTGAKVVIEIKPWARGCQGWFSFWFDVDGQRSRIGPDNLYVDAKPCMPKGFSPQVIRQLVQDFLAKGFPLTDLMREAIANLLSKLP